MEKSVYTDEYQVVIDLLRELRAESGMTQMQLAEALDQSQSFVSKYERGDRRLDVIQLRTVCATLGSSLEAFIQELESRLTPKSPGKRSQRR